MEVRFEQSVDGDSYCLAFYNPLHKDKYADIEFFDNGEVLSGRTNRVDPPEIKVINRFDIYSEIKSLIKFINES